MIGLVDGNNFFVSCERVFTPFLQNKPVAVLSNNDGCVISRSNEFKAFDIPMGTPYFKIKDKVDIYKLILKSCNHELYSDMSRRLMGILSQFAQSIEQYSIDEAFIYPPVSKDFDFEKYGIILRQTLLKWIGIPCGIGFAKTKTLAKIANHIGKKSRSGVFVMPENADEILSKLPVGEVWGVGRRLAPRLERLGIKSAFALAYADRTKLKRDFNITLLKTAEELRGEPSFNDDNPDDLSKSITCSRSFGHPVVSYQDMVESVAYYTSMAAEKLRGQGQRALGANIYFVYYPEKGEEFSSYTCIAVNFKNATDDTGKMLDEITPQLKNLFSENRSYKKSGITFWGLESGAIQGDLFELEKNIQPSKLYKTIDKLNIKFGKGTLFNAAEGIDKEWKMKRNMLSPNFTTDWNCIPIVK